MKVKSMLNIYVSPKVAIKKIKNVMGLKFPWSDKMLLDEFTHYILTINKNEFILTRLNLKSGEKTDILYSEGNVVKRILFPKNEWEKNLIVSLQNKKGV